MANLLLAVIYLAFVSLGLPDAMLGAAWPTMYHDFGVPVSFAGGISMVISAGTIVSALLSDRLTLRFGAGRVTAVSVGLTAAALLGFSFAPNYWTLIVLAVPYGLGAGGVDAALNNYVAVHYTSRHMSWLHAMWGVGASVGPYVMGFALGQGQGAAVQDGNPAPGFLHDQHSGGIIPGLERQLHIAVQPPAGHPAQVQAGAAIAAHILAPVIERPHLPESCAGNCGSGWWCRPPGPEPSRGGSSPAPYCPALRP